MTLPTEQEYADQLRRAIRLDELHAHVRPEQVLVASRRAQRRRTAAATLVALCGVLAIALAGPALAQQVRGLAAVPPATQPTAAESSDAQAQAHAWLDAAALPPGAVPADASVTTFSSYTGWPCGPVAELEAFWSIPGSTVSETANWLRENPTGGLISTGVGPVSESPDVQSATVGYIPAEGAQEGLVYTVEKTEDGVAVRAEVAALTAGASCPDLPDGGEYGAPGEG